MLTRGMSPFFAQNYQSRPSMLGGMGQPQPQPPTRIRLGGQPNLSFGQKPRGRFPTKPCPACNGTGKVPDMQAIKAMMGMEGGGGGMGMQG